MIPVIVESPYAGDITRNVRYLERCLRDCIDRGETPYASHKMLTTCLDDYKPEERALGIAAGLVWRKLAVLRVFYADLGWSSGMNAAKVLYDREGLIYVVREIGEPKEHLRCGVCRRGDISTFCDVCSQCRAADGYCRLPNSLI